MRKNAAVTSGTSPPRAAISIKEFCRSYGLSRPTFYNMIKRGDGPRFFRVGCRVLISTVALADWVAAREFAQSNKRTSRKAGA